jgi:cysteinyl-tRNA synthetase
MSAHYRSKLNFTWEALQNAQNSLKKLYDITSSYEEGENAEVNQSHYKMFIDALNDDINMPTAIAVVWDLLKSNISEQSKVRTLLKFDEVLGFNLENYVGYEVPKKVQDIARNRFEYRRSGIWDKADLLRREIEDMGFVVEDKGDSYKIKRKI